MKFAKRMMLLLGCVFLLSGCAEKENADSAAEPEESVQEDYQEDAEQEQSEEWDLHQEDNGCRRISLLKRWLPVPVWITILHR